MLVLLITWDCKQPQCPYYFTTLRINIFSFKDTKCWCEYRKEEPCIVIMAQSEAAMEKKVKIKPSPSSNPTVGYISKGNELSTLKKYLFP